jgi:hypothetical protein
MLKFLLTATKVAGLTYQLATTTVLIGALVVGVTQHVRGSRRKAG